MPQLMPGVSELDVRLAEIDRRLQEIQAGLEPDVEVVGPPAEPLAAAQTPPRAEAVPRPVEPRQAEPPVEPRPVEPQPAESRPVEPQSAESPAGPRVATGSSPRSGPLATLLARTRRRRIEGDAEDLATLVRMHSGLLDSLGELVRLLRPPAGGAGVQVPGPAAAILTAGPFEDTRQVEAFVVDVATLEPVREATLIGYEGNDRALIEVQLAEPSG